MRAIRWSSEVFGLSLVIVQLDRCLIPSLAVAFQHPIARPAEPRPIPLEAIENQELIGLDPFAQLYDIGFARCLLLGRALHSREREERGLGECIR